MKLIVSTFLVYKVKKCLLKSGKVKKNIAQNKSDVWALVARIMGIDCPAQGLPMPTWWAVDARVTGTNRPTEGHCGLTILVDHFLSYL